jgi:hypothetical protein
VVDTPGWSAPSHQVNPHVAPLNQVELLGFGGSLFGQQTSLPTTVQYAPANNDSLTASWIGGSLQFFGFGAIQAGHTYTTGVTVTGTNSCGGSGSYGSVEVDAFDVNAGGAVTSLALTFACVAADGNSAVFGTYAYNFLPDPTHPGYYLVGSDGSLSGFGNDRYLDYLNPLGLLQLNQPVVGAVITPSNAGYWLAAGDGGVFAYGDAGFYGSAGSLSLNQPIVGMAATPDGRGYWLVAADGGIFSYGDAAFYGSTGNLHLNQPVVGMAATPDGHGYWMVAADGGVFSYGDAAFYGSTGNLHLNQPVVGMAATPDGHGYWMVAADGGVFSYGDAGFYGSTGAVSLYQPIVGMTPTPDGRGYWFVGGDGGVFAFGDAPFYGSLGGIVGGVGGAVAFSVGGGTVGIAR